MRSPTTLAQRRSTFARAPCSRHRLRLRPHEWFRVTTSRRAVTIGDLWDARQSQVERDRVVANPCYPLHAPRSPAMVNCTYVSMTSWRGVSTNQTVTSKRPRCGTLGRQPRSDHWFDLLFDEGDLVGIELVLGVELLVDV